jgi:hypothetical protein
LSAYGSHLLLKIFCFASVFVWSPFRSWPCAGSRSSFYHGLGSAISVAQIHFLCCVQSCALIRGSSSPVPRSGFRFTAKRAVAIRFCRRRSQIRICRTQPDFQAFDFLRPDFHACTNRVLSPIPALDSFPAQCSACAWPDFIFSVLAVYFADFCCQGQRPVLWFSVRASRPCSA